jgi:DNA (cytosine-5)-methyltransferase 1
MQRVVAVDLFCGVGGLTRGLAEAGVEVAVGVDIDPTCQFPLKTNNPKTRYVLGDVASLEAAEVVRGSRKARSRYSLGARLASHFRFTP